MTSEADALVLRRKIELMQKCRRQPGRIYTVQAQHCLAWRRVSGGQVGLQSSLEQRFGESERVASPLIELQTNSEKDIPC